MRPAQPATEVITMAFDSRSGGQQSRRSSQPSPPPAPRPDGQEWNALREEGIQWEGQVLLAGSGIDVPALLVLTSSRLILFSNGQPALEVPRTWLRPEPKLLAADAVRVSITPHGTAGSATDTDRITIKVRDGRGEAARLVSSATGRIVSPREDRGITRTDVPSAWNNTVGASTPMALPPLPDFDDDPALARATRSWPPVEQDAVAPTPPASRTNPAPSISTWVSENLDDSPPSPATHTNRPAAVVPASEDHRQFHRGLVWGLRSLILAILVGTAVYFGQDRLPQNFTFQLPAAVEDRFGLNNDDEDPPTDVSQLPADSPGTGSTGQEPTATSPSSDGTNGATNTEDANEEGLGGNNGDITPVDPGIGDYEEEEPTTEPEGKGSSQPETTVENVPATEEPVNDPDTGETNEIPGRRDTGENPTEKPATEAHATEEPTEPAVTEAPVTEEPTQEPVTEEPVTEEPTQEPVTEEPVTEEPVTEEPATEEPTQEPATEEPTELPATEKPVTEEPATATPTEEPATEEPTEIPVTESASTPEPTLESQPPSVNPDVPPGQEVVNGQFRYTVTGVSRGETIAELPDLAPIETGEWVVLTLSGQNLADSEQVFDMSQFRLYADGQEVLLDVGNAWVSGQLGQTPAYGNTDAILWASGEGHEFTLTFLAPRGVESLTLVAGDQVIDLTASTGSASPIGASDAPAEATDPAYIEATVVGVIDAETIVIEVDGVRQTVRYLGIDAPTGDDCYADEASEANRSLVEGQVVRIERQATDVDAQGNWVRDVWVAAEDGSQVLVSEALIAEGAAIAGISEPNTRFAGWLLGSESAAQAEGAGLWAACETDGDAPPTGTTEARLQPISPVTRQGFR
jgi:endonuclease YncB( thermonuclease family)